MGKGSGEVSSNKQVAYQYATDIFLAMDLLKDASAVQEDYQTTVAGNTNAKEAIQLAKNAAADIANAVGLASNNLKSVANEFEAADATIRKMMQSSMIAGADKNRSSKPTLPFINGPFGGK